MLEYEAAGVALPAVGGLFVATDGGGDRTRTDWLRMHSAYFARTFERLGFELHPDPEVVFRRVLVER